MSDASHYLNTIKRDLIKARSIHLDQIDVSKVYNLLVVNIKDNTYDFFDFLFFTGYVEMTKYYKFNCNGVSLNLPLDMLTKASYRKTWWLQEEPIEYVEINNLTLLKCDQLYLIKDRLTASPRKVKFISDIYIGESIYRFYDSLNDITYERLQSEFKKEWTIHAVTTKSNM